MLYRKKLVKSLAGVLTLLLGLFSFTGSQAAPRAEIIKFWLPSIAQNEQTINHGAWQAILDVYLADNHASGVNRFNYLAVTKVDKEKLSGYLTEMQDLDPRDYSRVVQKAYWINLYNALTVKLVLDNLPVDSITEVGQSFFKFGPWDDVVATVVGQELSLNNIEHGILRPIWRDNRIHYAVNCASMSCPNLSGVAFTENNTELLLEQAATEYVNHVRGVSFVNGDMRVSSIYIWYLADFGGENTSLVDHLKKYADADLMKKLQRHKGDIEHGYDWQLNKPGQQLSLIAE
ncbi:MAG: DUF547 domain-containing protein [Pseudomonadales bacterium]|nr:DUF547 domain-containing protein [Pseudomonadales bacterium]